MSNMSLLKLPVELLHSIFDYVDTQTILYSFRPVCTQLYAVVKTYNKLRLDFSTFCKSDLTLVADFIKPENVISLKLFNNYGIKSCRVDLFFLLFQLDQFTRLQSLTLVEINGTELDQFFQHIITCPLRSLSITLQHQKKTETQRIINLLSSTIAQSGLQNLHLNIPDAALIIDRILEPVQSLLRHLTIENCNYYTYHVTLCRCVHLQTFVIKNCTFENINQTRLLPSFVCSSYPQLTSLTLNKCSLSIDKLHLVLSLTPSLVHLQLTSRRSTGDSIFDGYLWEQFIQTKLPLLKKFEFFFTYSTYFTMRYPSLDLIITPFRTPFWLNDKHWLVTCDYVVTSSEIIVHTIPLYTDDYNVVIRCDSLSLNKCHRLLTGYWINHLEHVSTEQTLTTLDLSIATITERAAQHFAVALRNDTILTTLKLQKSMTTIGIEYIVNALESNKTLTTLYIQRSHISNSLAQYLAHALKHNKTLTTVSLGYNQMGASEAKHFEHMLWQNTTLIDLTIQNNKIGDQGTQYIANPLNQNRTLKILNLEQNGISGLGAKFLADGLKNNTTLVTLDLQNNFIGDEGAQHFADALQTNTTLTTLILAYNLIGASGIKYLKDALRNNITLTTLNLGGNSIETVGADYLADALRNNTTLNTLILAYNQLGPTGTKYLADALENNNMLTTIDLRANKIGLLGAKHLTDALQNNTTLTTLYIRGNDIGPTGGEYFADLLRNNSTLITLILENNQIEDQGTEHLAKALENNMTLKTLNLAQNNIGTSGIKHMANALQNNTTLTTLFLTKNKITTLEAEHFVVALRTNLTITTLHIQENNSIDNRVMNIIDELLERNKKLLEENIEYR